MAICEMIQMLIDTLDKLINLNENKKVIPIIDKLDLRLFEVLQFQESIELEDFNNEIIFQNRKSIFFENIIHNLLEYQAEEEEARLISKVSLISLNHTTQAYLSNSQEFIASNELRKLCHLILLKKNHIQKDGIYNLSLESKNVNLHFLNDKSNEKITLFRL